MSQSRPGDPPDTDLVEGTSTAGAGGDVPPGEHGAPVAGKPGAEAAGAPDAPGSPAPADPAGTEPHAGSDGALPTERHAAQAAGGDVSPAAGAGAADTELHAGDDVSAAAEAGAAVAAVEAPGDDGLRDDIPETDPDDLPDDDRRSGGRRRQWPGVLVRTFAVLVAAGIGYYLVVPTTVVVRSHLASLMITSTGTTAFPGKPSNASERPATTGGLKSLEAAAKASPNRTGLYVASWTQKKNPQDGLAAVTFLLPDAKQAEAVRTELAKVQLTPDAFKSSGLQRSAQFTPPGIPGAVGSVYSAAPKSNQPGKVAVTVWRNERVVGLVEAVLASGNPEPDAVTAAKAEAAHLDKAEPGFSLTATRYPPLASALWIAGAVVLALLAGFGPVLVRARRDRRQRMLEEELARTIRVGGQKIVRHRS